MGVSATFALLTRELRLALRSGGGAGLGLAFFLIVVMLIPFGVGPVPHLLAQIAPGTLWIAALVVEHGARLCSRDAHFGCLAQLDVV